MPSSMLTPHPSKQMARYQHHNPALVDYSTNIDLYQTGWIGKDKLWVIEVLFNVLDHKGYFAPSASQDSAVVAVHLSREEIHREAQGMTIDICLNLLAYGYMVYRQFADMKTTDVVG
eukprot:scaffold56180_cov77-Cyclotella_meneghiniana.AAC.7